MIEGAHVRHREVKPMAGTSAGSLRRGASLDGLKVADVLIRRPKTLPPDATVAQARQAFEDDHVHMLLLVSDADELIGTLVRTDLPDGTADGHPARPYAVLNERTLNANLDAEAARHLLLARDERRRAVVDNDGRLLGLLCLKRRRTGFCSEDDVSSRAAERGSRPCGPEYGHNG
jgi:CBS domain-containing protein